LRHPGIKAETKQKLAAGFLKELSNGNAKKLALSLSSGFYEPHTLKKL
jgi:hypothetical protein